MTEQIQDNPTPAEGIPHASIQEFRNTQNVVIAVTAAFGVSLLMIIVIAVNLYLLFISSSNKPMMPGLIGGMSVIPIFGIAAGIYFLKRPRKIIIGPQGLVIIGVMSRKEIGWRDIADIEIKEAESISDNWIKSFSGQSAMQKKRLILRDSLRRQIGAVDGNIEGFDTLAALIVSNSSQSQGKPVFDTDLQTSRTMAARKKKMRLNLGLGIFLSLMAIASIVVFSIDHVSKTALESQGQNITAVIGKHYKYNITPRLEYTFTAADGKAYTKDVIVEKIFWEQLKEGDTIPVKYVPSNPDNSRLLKGYVDDFDIPFPLMIIMGGAILALGAGCACMYVFKIVDIKHEKGKWIIVRLNDPDPLLVTPTPAPTAIPQHQNIHMPQTVSVISPEIQREERKLPGGLKAIGILNIIFGILGVLWNGSRIALVLIFVLNPEALPIQVDMSENWKWVMFGHGVSLLCALSLCISGIGILRFANWGRILAILAVSVKLVMGLWEMGNIILVPIENAAKQQAYIVNVTKVFVCLFTIATLIYPLIVFILLNRRSTRQCFQRKSQ